MKIRSIPIWTGIMFLLACAGMGLFIIPRIPDISNYPFSLSWSESGRIFTAYQVYSGLLSGHSLAWPWLDTGRSILDGLVLLLPFKQIWMYRLWINFLFVLLAFLTSFATVRKAFSFSSLQQVGSRQKTFWILVLWGLLFLLQGPVYYHVLLGVVGVFWFFDAKKPVRTLLIVIVSSVWEGLCRVNWFVMPAVVAALLYFLSQPYSGKKLLTYLKWPALLLAAGGIASSLTYFMFIKANGYVIPFFDSNMDYAYFLYKLWPNAGFIGLIPGMLLISSLLMGVCLYVLWKQRGRLHWLRLLLMAGILAVFFGGSTVVAIRAGGGYDFHNYDSFMLLLFTCGCFLGLNAVAFDRPASHAIQPLGHPAIQIGLLLITLPFLYSSSSPASARQVNTSPEMLQRIEAAIHSVEPEGQPVLFIDQRQLLVFGSISSTDIYVPYDKIELMEMAMARNGVYAQQFSKDIQNQKFSLIVSEILQPWAKRFEPGNFERDWYENNAWVTSVSQPILAYYKPIFEDPFTGIGLYAPR
jgi:hypothetical protein